MYIGVYCMYAYIGGGGLGGLTRGLPITLPRFNSQKWRFFLASPPTKIGVQFMKKPQTLICTIIEVLLEMIRLDVEMKTINTFSNMPLYCTYIYQCCHTSTAGQTYGPYQGKLMDWFIDDLHLPSTTSGGTVTEVSMPTAFTVLLTLGTCARGVTVVC